MLNRLPSCAAYCAALLLFGGAVFCGAVFCFTPPIAYAADAEKPEAAPADASALTPENVVPENGTSSGPPDATAGLETVPDIFVATSALVKKNADMKPAWDKLQALDKPGALEILRPLVAKDRALPPAEFLVALFFYDRRDGNRAVSALDEAVRAHPDDPAAYLALGSIAVGQGRFTDATLLLERAEKLIPALPADHPRHKVLDAALCSQMAMVANRFERWPQARDYLKRLLVLLPEDAIAHYRLAQVLLRLNERQQGYAELQAAYQRNRRLPTPPIAVVMYCQQTGQPALAEKWMKYAEQKYDTDAPTRATLASWQWEAGRLPDAKRHATAAASQDARSVMAQFMLGIIAHYEGDLDAAEQRLDAAYRLAPNDVQVRDHLAAVLITSRDQAKRDRAERLAIDAVRQTPSSPDAIATLGWIQYNMGKTDDAMRAFGAVSKAQISSDAAYYLARVLADKKSNDDAVKLLENVLKDKGLFVQRPAAEELLKKLKS
ncbi:MAG: tetratricopeptide repeat protein [Planctomycetia bacterium]|nr:tetratricopeptide repeat protein [Planctomycetia bacterium]